MLGTQTWGSRMVGADESTELWRHPFDECLFVRGSFKVPIADLLNWVGYNQQVPKYVVNFSVSCSIHLQRRLVFSVEIPVKQEVSCGQSYKAHYNRKLRC